MLPISPANTRMGEFEFEFEEDEDEDEEEDDDDFLFSLVSL